MVAFEPQGNLFRVGIPYQPDMSGGHPAAFTIVKLQNSEMSQACNSSSRKSPAQGQILRPRIETANNIMHRDLPWKSDNSESYLARTPCQQFGLCTIRTILDDFDASLDCMELSIPSRSRRQGSDF